MNAGGPCGAYVSCWFCLCVRNKIFLSTTRVAWAEISVPHYRTAPSVHRYQIAAAINCKIFYCIIVVSYRVCSAKRSNEMSVAALDSVSAFGHDHMNQPSLLLPVAVFCCSTRNGIFSPNSFLRRCTASCPGIHVFFSLRNRSLTKALNTS